MKKKRIIKLWRDKWYFRVLIYVLGLTLVTPLKVFLDKLSWDDIVELSFIELGKESLKILLSIGIILGAIINEIRLAKARNQEDEKKIEKDENKILKKYYGHKVGYEDKLNKNYYDSEGFLIQLSDNYDKNKDKKLTIPSLNLFANIEGNINLNPIDSLEMKQLPDLLVNLMNQIMLAHRYSKISNFNTIRLKNLDYNEKTKKLSIITERSTNYFMLSTNRCMDYNLRGITVRELYEYFPKISSLSKSLLGNQIGMNGVIVTNDGYLLLSKKNKNSSNQKNKIGQPIAYVLKELEITEIDKKISDDFEEKLINIIKYRIQDKLKLEQNEYEEMNISNNFMGISRDLLEGGKPSFNFYVELKLNSKDLAKKFEDKSIRSNLISPFYLINYDDIKIDDKYHLNIEKNSYIKINPKKRKNAISRKKLKNKCSESLMENLFYLELVKNRISSLKK